MRTCEPVEIPSKPALPRYNEPSLDISFWACAKAIKGTRHAIRINGGPGIFEKQRPQILRWRVPKHGDAAPDRNGYRLRRHALVEAHRPGVHRHHFSGSVRWSGPRESRTH